MQKLQPIISYLNFKVTLIGRLRLTQMFLENFQLSSLAGWGQNLYLWDPSPKVQHTFHKPIPCLSSSLRQQPRSRSSQERRLRPGGHVQASDPPEHGGRPQNQRPQQPDRRPLHLQGRHPCQAGANAEARVERQRALLQHPTVSQRERAPAQDGRQHDHQPGPAKGPGGIR